MGQELEKPVAASAIAEVAKVTSKETPGVSVSVLIPAFNEAEHIKRRLEEVTQMLSGLGVGFEIVVVDDGSRDDTRSIASAQMERLPVKVVGYKDNRGKGAALKYGSRFAAGEITVFLDCDGEVSPLDILEYLAALRNVDLAIGSKRHPMSRVDAPSERKFLSAGFNYLVRFLTGIKYPDTQSGLKAFRSSALKKIMPLVSVKRYAFDVELLTVASLLRMKVVEMPVRIQLSARFHVKHVMRMLVDLFGIAYRLRIRRWYQRNLTNGQAKYRPHIRW